MKNISVYLIYTLALIGCGAATAQDIQTIPTPKARTFNNTLRFSAGDYYTPGVGRVSGTIHQVGVHYERNICRNWFAGLGYAQWKTISTGYPYIGDSFYPTTQDEMAFLSDPDPKIGQLTARSDYKMLDIYAFYKLRDTATRRHAINIGAGVSYTWGGNSYLKSYYRNPVFPFDAHGESEGRNVGYLGVIPSLSYDYTMFKSRIIAGFNFRARYYFGMDMQYDYSVHIGLNF